MTGKAGPDFSEVAGAIGHDFADPRLLCVALTHPSALAGSGRRRKSAGAPEVDNQRLEFLGDRVLGLVVAEMLYAAFPAEDEGALAKRFAVLVREECLARVAGALDLGRHLVLSKGEAGGGGRQNPASLADACEAIIGAIFLDGGLDAARSFINRMWRPMLLAEAKPPQDAKTALQEWAQAHGFPLPVYEVVSSSGPPHEPTFVVRVRVSGQTPVDAAGRTKRTAEQAAARALLADLGS